MIFRFPIISKANTYVKQKRAPLSYWLILVLLLGLFSRDSFAEQARQSAGRSKETTKPLSSFEVGRYQYCGKDSDCVWATNGCCDCNSGAQDVAVNKERLQAFKERFACSQYACPKRPPLPPECGQGVITCVNHKCQYITDAQFEAKGKNLQRK